MLQIRALSCLSSEPVVKHSLWAPNFLPHTLLHVYTPMLFSCFPCLLHLMPSQQSQFPCPQHTHAHTLLECPAWPQQLQAISATHCKVRVTYNRTLVNQVCFPTNESVLNTACKNVFTVSLGSLPRTCLYLLKELPSSPPLPPPSHVPNKV